MPFSRDFYETGDGPEILTDSRMPPFGVAQMLVDYTRLGDDPDPLTALPSSDLFRFWLLSHTDMNVLYGAKLWRTAVLRECLPSPDAVLNFEALAEPLQ